MFQESTDFVLYFIYVQADSLEKSCMNVARVEHSTVALDRRPAPGG